MRAFLGLWTAAMLFTAGFGAAGTSPEQLIRVIYADAYGAAQVLDGRASLAAQWTEDALRSLCASGTQGLFPTTLGKGAPYAAPGVVRERFETRGRSDSNELIESGCVALY